MRSDRNGLQPVLADCVEIQFDRPDTALIADLSKRQCQAGTFRQADAAPDR